MVRLRILDILGFENDDCKNHRIFLQIFFVLYYVLRVKKS